MKTFIIILSMLLSFSVFASTQPSTHCQAIELLNGKLYLSQFHALDENSPFNNSILDKNGNYIKIEDLSVNVKNTVLIDEIEKTGSNFAGRYKTHSKIFAVKFHLESDSTSLGTEIQGCFMREVKKIDAYAICFQNQTTLPGH